MHDTLVIDLETKKSFAEVGGEAHIRDLGIAVAGVYSYQKDIFFALEERELPLFEKMLLGTSHLIGFNIKHFDIPVLEPYLQDPNALDHIRVTDMYEDAVKFLGHRVGLNALAKATLGREKSGHGLEALEWFKQGRVEEVKRYCLDDVRLTKDLYEHGKKHGHVLFESYIDRKNHSIPVHWGKEPSLSTKDLLEEARTRRRRVAIRYVSAQDSDGSGYAKTRLIDVYRMGKDKIEAYCHLRQEKRNFQIKRILNVTLTDDVYNIPEDTQVPLFK